MVKRLLIAAALVVGMLVVPGRPADAVPPATGDYCVVHVTGQKATGELTVSTPRCYADLATSMRAEGVSAWGAGASQRAAALTDFTIGYHCDGFGLAAPCTSVVGSSCSGGWLNLSSVWNNRISSTLSGCPQINHFDGTNLTGAVKSTFGAGPFDLTTFNNITSSIQYT
jgi:hypothetical protein